MIARNILARAGGPSTNSVSARLRQLKARGRRSTGSSDVRARDIFMWALSEHPDVIPLGEVLPGSFATIAGLIESIQVDPSQDRLCALVRDHTGQVRASWSRPKRALLPGQGVVLRGRIRSTLPSEMFNPRVSVITDDENRR